MPVSKFISTSKLFEYLDSEVSEALLDGVEVTESPEKKWDTHVAKHRVLIDGAVSNTSKWYLDLVRATSLVFDVEYALRQSCSNWAGNCIG